MCVCVCVNVEACMFRKMKKAGGGMGFGGGCERGWRVNQGISVHPLMSASVNKAHISCRHIRWLSRPLGPSWLAEAAHCSQETHLRVYRHLWLVIGSPREINGTMGAASQLSCAHTHSNHQRVRLNARARTPSACMCERTHRRWMAHVQRFLCIPGKLTFAVKILQLY